MGNSMRKEVQVILEGRPGSGKSSALFHLKHGETLLTPTPGIEGFYVERAVHAGTKLNVWEVQPSSTIVRAKSLTVARALVYVIDSTGGSAGIQDAKEDLYPILTALASQRLRTCFTVLILANKQDIPAAASPATIERDLAISSRPDGSTWRWAVQSCSAKEGLGLKEGMDWLAKAVRGKNVSTPRPKGRSRGGRSSKLVEAPGGGGRNNGIVPPHLEARVGRGDLVNALGTGGTSCFPRGAVVG